MITPIEASKKIAPQIIGTADSIFYHMERIGAEDIEVNDIEEALLDEGVERCQGCDWWFESGELVPDPDEEADIYSDEGTGYCTDCRDTRKAKEQ